MAQINVFRMRRSYVDSAAGYLTRMGDVLRELAHSDSDILEHTDVVIVPDEALHPWSDFEYVNQYDPRLETLVNDEIECQRMQHQTMTVSIPMHWIQQETETLEEGHWQLRFNGRVVANVIKDGLWETYYTDHEDHEVFMGCYESLKGAMEAIHAYFGRNE